LLITRWKLKYFQNYLGRYSGAKSTIDAWKNRARKSHASVPLRITNLNQILMGQLKKLGLISRSNIQNSDLPYHITFRPFNIPIASLSLWTMTLAQTIPHENHDFRRIFEVIKCAFYCGSFLESRSLEVRNALLQGAERVKRSPLEEPVNCTWTIQAKGILSQGIKHTFQ